MSEQPSHSNDEIEIVISASIDLSPAAQQALIHAMQSALLFGTHDDLVRLDDALDNLYPEADG